MASKIDTVRGRRRLKPTAHGVLAPRAQGLLRRIPQGVGDRRRGLAGAPPGRRARQAGGAQSRAPSTTRRRRTASTRPARQPDKWFAHRGRRRDQRRRVTVADACDDYVKHLTGGPALCVGRRRAGEVQALDLPRQEARRGRTC
ncbi:MAG: hypothetical protein MZW92_80825 [Comamonadaceae bacterium]|nr:hypothetical protein [Comamonadaceae bacterium]